MSTDIGTEAPTFTLPDTDGTEHSPGGARATLVVFTCNHCPFAKAWETRIVELGNTYAAKGIGVVAVNANDPKVAAEDDFDGMQKRAKDRGMQFPYVVDATSNVARAFGATRTPEAFLFDKDGKLVYHGTIDDNGEDATKVEKSYLKDALEAVASGKDVAVKETKSIGCGIKFRT
jgi:peroxiredoxin